MLIPQKGKVLYRGNDVYKRLPETLSDIFIVPEEFELPNVTLENYVKMYSPFYPKFSEDEMKRCLDVFEMQEKIHLGSLSMGQKKKVFMSFALATNTSLLIMDEPTNGLDIPGKSQFRKFMATAINENRTVVISTHQIRDIDKIIDHVLILDENEILLNESVDKIGKKLLFVESSNRDLTENTIYSQSSIHGNSLILENFDNDESEINLETLFNAALYERDKIKGMFNSK